MARNKLLCFTVLLCSCLLFAPTAFAVNEYSVSTVSMPSILGHTEDDFIQVYDTNGKYIFGSCIGVSEGDRYVDENNKEYKVTKVEGKRATAKYVRKVNLTAGDGYMSSAHQMLPLVQGKSQKLIGLYHTHSDESYTPGPVSKPRGEIYNVGSVLKSQFEQKGIKTIQSQDSFLPHDGGAYDRSRRTAVEFLKMQPDAIFDVHRDAIPRASEYLTNVAGNEVSKVRLVVGRQNPNMAANEQLAQRIKAVADQKYPGLVKGIFYAKGKYNQDLSPRALLLEFGTHVTSKDDAEKSTAAMVDSIYTVLYGAKASTGGGKTGTNRAQGGAGWTALLWVIGIAVVVGGIFLFLNEGGFGEVKGRLRSFTGEEFANVLGRKKKNKKKRK